ncbi:monosaccharide-transporting ATPase [Frigoribacterium sp. PvP120]|uniref:sugar ABC transporter ATP-binding protein n=1 Tax=unclassified Frigoribacterium TaxID=2627005 RepID=UPI001B47840A|nr:MULTISPECIES: sugar ABC transporter ATP-binding protein [unclassified Frigoribacterium]MBP1240807.1 simple sugar transport system ATP-binding protein [Frigoribacterium sp. PvP121]
MDLQSTATPGSPHPTVEMVGIDVVFTSGPALTGARLCLAPGEIHGLMGQNGAGKSTLIKTLTGIHRPDAGTVTVDGVERRFSGPADARSAGISAVFQDEWLTDNLSIGENMMLGHEVRGRFGISWSRTHQRAAEVLGELGMGAVDPRASVRSLSPALRQLVAIGRAMIDRPRVLVLDEPTSSLDLDDVVRLFAVLRRLRDSGVAILFVSHFLEQVLALSDRITVLRDGSTVGEYPAHSMDRAELIASMLGEDIEALRRIGADRRQHRRQPVGPPMYQALGLGRRGAVAPTDLELHRGEIVGFAGLRGSGRTEMASLLSGADRFDRGRVLIDGEPTQVAEPRSGMRNRIAHASENRHEDGIISELSVRENIVLGIQALRGWSRPLSAAETDGLVRAYVDSLDISPADPDLLAKYLSGGNQQKVVLARCLATMPRLLVLDEPTKGIDVASKVDIQAHVVKLATDGVAIVYISSDLDEVVRLSDRIVVFKDREKIGEVSNGPWLTVDTIVEMIAADR